MYYWVILLSVFFLSGCGVTVRSNTISAHTTVLEPAIGMNRAEVSGLLLKKVIVGYEVDPVGGVPQPIEASSLYATEFLSVGQDSYLIDSYVTGIMQTKLAEGGARVVSETGLTPMIFKDNVLVAKGREALSELKKQAVR